MSSPVQEMQSKGTTSIVNRGEPQSRNDSTPSPVTRRIWRTLRRFATSKEDRLFQSYVSRAAGIRVNRIYTYTLKNELT